MKTLQSLLERFLAWWRPAPLIFIELPPAVLETPLPSPPPAELPSPPQSIAALPRSRRPRRVRYERSRDAPGDTAFHWRESLLDQLDAYMFYIRRMRKVDRASYEIYSRIGGTIIPESAYYSADPKFTARWRAGYRGSFACLAFGIDDKHDDKASKKVPPRFIYYQRLDKPPPFTIEQVAGGANYMVVGYYDTRDSKHRYGSPLLFYVNIDDNCRLRMLRELEVITSRVRHKRRVPGYPNVSIIPTGLAARFHPEIEDWAKRAETDIHTYVAELFCIIAEAQERPGMVRVAATKNHLTAAFSVGIEATPSFFADRQAHYNDRGHKKRIFHIVKPHIKANGQTVKMHFRGERDFIWKDYAIHITVPGLHHKMLEDLEIASHVNHTNAHESGYIGAPRFARKLQRHLAN